MLSLTQKKGNLKMYNPKSLKAEEFICHEEVEASLKYADEHKNDLAEINRVLEKAKQRKGLSHREALLLLDCDIPEKNAEIFALAEQIKKDFYGNRIVLFAPLYLSNYCVNGCVYCPYHAKNKHIPRKKLTQEEVAAEVIALQDMGHKRLAIESGEDPVNNPIEYILDCIKTIYSIKHKNGAIRRVNVNIAATTVENYRKLKEAGIGTYILFQETYHKESYEKLHPTGPKHDYAYHTPKHGLGRRGGSGYYRVAHHRHRHLLHRQFFPRAMMKSKDAPHFKNDALTLFESYDWPGNVRQLKNILEWLMIINAEDCKEITADMLPAEINSSAPDSLRWERSESIMSLPLKDARDVFEKEYLEAQLKRFGDNVSKTASFVGMERSALYRKFKTLGIDTKN